MLKTFQFLRITSFDVITNVSEWMIFTDTFFRFPNQQMDFIRIFIPIEFGSCFTNNTHNPSLESQ